MPKGGVTFAAIGYLLRLIKSLPAPVRERALDALTGGVSANLPPFPDVMRMVETAGGIPDGRRWQERLLGERPHLRGVSLRDIDQKNRNGRIRARLYQPPKDIPAAKAAFVWVHGGAFVLGSLDAKEAHWLAIELAASGIPVLSVDYRLCIKGVHYPAPQDDVLNAWQWAVDHFSELGIDVSHLHLGGGSAGGCLAAGVTLRLRDAGLPMPASLYLAYPVLEGILPLATPDVADVLAPLKLPSDEWISDMFTNWAGSASWDDPYVTPAVADLKGFPPTYILTCGHDTLRRSSTPFVQRISAAGIPVWEDLLPSAEHAPLDRPGTADGESAIARLKQWLAGGVASMAA